MPTQNVKLLSGFDAIHIGNELANSDVLVYFVANSSLIESTAKYLKFFLPSETDILEFPPYDTRPYDKISPSNSVISKRLKTLVSLCHLENKYVVVTTLDAVMQYLPPKTEVENNSLRLKVGQKANRVKLIENLVASGFVRLSNAFHAGEFAVKGSILDIVTEEGFTGHRIDFFGDDIESIRIFNIESQATIDKADKVEIIPSTEIFITPNSKELFNERARLKFGLKAENLIEQIEDNRKPQAAENLLPLFYDKCSDFTDHLPLNSKLLLPNTHEISYNSAFSKVEEMYEERKKYCERTKEDFFFLEPYERSIEPDKFKKILSKFSSETYVNFVLNDETLKAAPSFASLAKAEKDSAFNLFNKYVSQLKNKHVMIGCFSEGSLDRIKNFAKDHEIIISQISSYDQLKNSPKGIVYAGICPLDSGFETEELLVVSEQDILGERLSKRGKSSTTSANVFADFAALSVGEIVVHIEHGIGRFEGIETIKVANFVRDFIKITYAGSDKLYVPVENFDLISRYGSDTNELDKLGATSWQTRKAKLKNRIKLAAEQLLKTAAERAISASDPLVPLAGAFEEFVEKFPYVETNDQLSAIEAILEDFASGKPMDRLVCGDVGFGKTEVALRAAFIAVASGHNLQVAVLVPTTLLARQHFKTFSERFEGFPIRIKQLSKFTQRSEVKHTKKAIEEGGVDIIIGTHALLAKDIKFKNLGMIIIDEEQHFGVSQKERLKELKANTHVLTLSATPIPRTLQMSLSGIKDLSIIATPPVDRLPIRTYVMPYDGLTIREAILREFYRSGRVFYVTPRTAYLDSIMEKLKEILPEIKAVKAHGGMTASELDQIMNDFYDGKYHVLVSTTIVESGLDVPFANTMIVDRADMFGLAQLYQIRGRVGRSNNQAYAYLTYPDGIKLNDIAQKRLSILGAIDNLGAGFSIASHDMDIRGYGNLVGDEQSGHIKEVGIELYQHMLEEAVSQIKLEKDEAPQDKDWSPVLNIGISIQIPETYIEDAASRLAMYRKIASISDEIALESIAAEMTDRYGKMPEEADHLFAIVKLKSLAKIANIEKLDIGEKGVLVAFKNGIPVSVEKVLDFVAKSNGEAKLRPDQKLFISRTWGSSESTIKGVEKILKHLT